MNIRPYLGQLPTLGERVYVDRTASVTGDVLLGAEVALRPGTGVGGAVTFTRRAAPPAGQGAGSWHRSQTTPLRAHCRGDVLDLADGLFLATANVLESIPAPLLDRRELVRLDGYTEDEKGSIGRDHLMRRQLERAGLTEDEATFTDDALRRLYNGTYGICEVSGKPISRARLEALPGARLSIEEQAKFEREQRAGRAAAPGTE